MTLSSVLGTLVDYVWGLPLVFLLIGGGIYLAALSRLLPLRGFMRALQLMLGFYHHKKDATAAGQLSHFQALANALAATIGLGNIAGVAVAITQGGPGAIFWMWVAGLVGMNTKFFECSLSVMYRGKDYLGEVQGGPMYVIEKALPRRFKFLALFFAICGALGTVAVFQANQVSVYLLENFSVPKLMTGSLFAVLVGYIMFGGLRRLAHVTSALVPLMCVLYVVCCSLILFQNIEKIPTVFALIFQNAFTGGALFGGAAGIGVIEVLKTGVKRAAFSNEAGVGTAPMAHGNAKTAEPISEGLVAMLGPLFDTLIVCTATALVILVSVDGTDFSAVSGIRITVNAFEKSLGQIGLIILGLSVVLFGFTTMLGMANYGSKCWNYLFKGHFLMSNTTFTIFFCATLVWGSFTTVTNVVNFVDIAYGLMAVPNMIVTLWLARKVKEETEKYFKKYQL